MRPLPLLSLVLVLLLAALVGGGLFREHAVSANPGTANVQESGLTELAAIEPERVTARTPEPVPGAIALPQASFSEVRGRLVSENGEPLARVAVEFAGHPAPHREHAALEEPGSVLIETITNDQGLFAVQFDSPRVFEWELEALSRGRARRNWSFDAIETGTFIDLGPQAMHKSGSIAGIVTNSQGVRTSLGWTIHTWNMDVGFGAYERVHVARAQASCSVTPGSFMIEGLSPGKHGLYAQLDTGEWIGLPSITVYAGEVSDTLVTLPTQGRDRSIVVHAAVGVFSISRTCVTLTGPFGSRHKPTLSGRVFEFEDLDPGEYQFVLDDPRFEPAQLSGLIPGQPAASLNLTGSAALRLDVLDEHSQTRLANWSLRIGYGERTEFSPPSELTTLQAEWMTPRSGGLFEGIIAEPLWLVIGAQGHADRTIAVRDLRPMETRILNISLESSTLVAGIVQSVSGKRCSRATVRLLQDGAVIGEVKTDPRGRFEFANVQPGTYSLACEAGGGRRSTLPPFTLQATSRPIDRVLEVSDGYWLTGIIREREFRHLDSCQLRAWATDAEDPAALPGIPTSEGAFRLGPFAEGTIQLRMTLPGTGFLLDLGQHEVGRSEGPVVIDLLDRMPAELLVRVDTTRDDPAGITLEAVFESGEREQRASIPINPDGLADFGFVPPGEFQFSVTGPVPGAHGQWRQASLETLQLLTGERAFHIVEASLIEGEVLILEGEKPQPLRDGWVTLTSKIKEEQASVQVRTDARGRLRLELPEGSYELSRRGAEGSEGSSQRVDWTVSGPAPSVVELPY